MSKPGSVRGRVKYLEQLVGLLLQVVEQHDKYLYAQFTFRNREVTGEEIDITALRDAITARQGTKEVENDG